jgi:hypothetical protein
MPQATRDKSLCCASQAHFDDAGIVTSSNTADNAAGLHIGAHTGPMDLLQLLQGLGAVQDGTASVGRSTAALEAELEQVCVPA